MSGLNPRRRLALGRVVATPGALEALMASNQSPEEFLTRHAHCDWGDVDEEDQEANDRSLEVDERILSVYWTSDEVRLWIITEADRSVTTVLLPHEY